MNHATGKIVSQAGAWSRRSVSTPAGVGSFVRAQWDELRHAAAGLLAGLAAFRCVRSGSADVKSSPLQTILKGAGRVSTLWLAFCAKGHDQENKDPNSRA